MEITPSSFRITMEINFVGDLSFKQYAAKSLFDHIYILPPLFIIAAMEVILMPLLVNRITQGILFL